MNTLTLLPKANYKRATWKNGLGFTDEIAIYPLGADLRKGDFLWRLSSARIEQASNFSVFPVHDRVLLVLKGEGIRLSHRFEDDGEEETTDLPTFNAYEFPGDIQSRCELLSGPITDLSVFVRKAEVEPLVEAVTVTAGEGQPWVPAGRWNFLYAVEGTFEVSAPFSPGIRELKEGDTLAVELSAPVDEENPVRIAVTSGDDGKIVLISLQS